MAAPRARNFKTINTPEFIPEICCLFTPGGENWEHCQADCCCQSHTVILSSLFHTEPKCGSSYNNLISNWHETSLPFSHKITGQAKVKLLYRKFPSSQPKIKNGGEKISSQNT